MFLYPSSKTHVVYGFVVPVSTDVISVMAIITAEQ
jgi:hypothetical protein